MNITYSTTHPDHPKSLPISTEISNTPDSLELESNTSLYKINALNEGLRNVLSQLSNEQIYLQCMQMMEISNMELTKRGCSQISVTQTVPTDETTTEALQPASSTETLFNTQSTLKYYKSESGERIGMHKSEFQASLPASLTEITKEQTSESNVKKKISNSDRMTDAIIPATPSILSQMESNELVLPSIDDFMSSFIFDVSKKREKSTDIKIIAITAQDSSFDYERPLIFTNKAIEYFTAAKINHDTLKDAIKYTKVDTRLDTRDLYVKSMSCFYIDNQSIIKTCDEVSQTNTDFYDELCCFYDKSLNCSPSTVNAGFIHSFYGLDRFIRHNCFDIIEVFDAEYDTSETQLSIQINESKLIAYIAAKRYKNLMNLFANILNSPYDSETIMNYICHIYFPSIEDSSEASHSILTPEAIFKNVKLHTLGIEAQLLKAKYPETL
ncbi:MAG: hypothetical protein KAG53_12290 [Endozoicomonadaceae bacterium]|nr:hypothetical protein [Endozoicomonadaceae bacterium]